MEYTTERPPMKDWAVLVYIAADVSQRGMHKAALDNLQQMVNTGSGEQVYVAAQYDSPGNPTRRYVFPERFAGDGLPVVTPVDSLDNVNSADPLTIEKFFAWGIHNCPAKNTMLVLWGHGFGLDDFTPKGFRKSSPSLTIRSEKHTEVAVRKIAADTSTGTVKFTEGAVIVDENSQEVLTNHQVGDALRVCEMLARKAGGNLAIMGFDACAMSMAEVWCELADGAQIGIGSQASLPFTSWPYDLFLTRLLAKPSAEAKEVAGMLIDSFAEFYRDRNNFVTLSACDLKQLEKLKLAVAPLGRALTAVVNDPDARRGILSARDSCPCYDPDGFIDLDTFCAFLEADVNNVAVQKACRQVRDELKGFVIDSTFSPPDPNLMISLSGGVSVWFPPWIENPSVQEEEKAQSEAYLESGYPDTSFAKATEWDKFLKGMLQGSSAMSKSGTVARLAAVATPTNAGEGRMSTDETMGGHLSMGGHKSMGGHLSMGGHKSMGKTVFEEGTSGQAGVVVRATVESFGTAGETELNVTVKWPAGSMGVQSVQPVQKGSPTVSPDGNLQATVIRPVTRRS